MHQYSAWCDHADVVNDHVHVDTARHPIHAHVAHVNVADAADDAHDAHAHLHASGHADVVSYHGTSFHAHVAHPHSVARAHAHVRAHVDAPHHASHPVASHHNARPVVDSTIDIHVTGVIRQRVYVV